MGTYASQPESCWTVEKNNRDLHGWLLFLKCSQGHLRQVINITSSAVKQSKQHREQLIMSTANKVATRDHPGQLIKATQLLMNG